MVALLIKGNHFSIRSVMIRLKSYDRNSEIIVKCQYSHDVNSNTNQECQPKHCAKHCTNDDARRSLSCHH